MIMILLHTNGFGVQWVNAAYVGGKGGPFMVAVTVFLRNKGHKYKSQMKF